jgi:probable F420-dependent oxidoreductase
MPGSTRKFRFGLAVRFPDTVQEWRDLARKTEEQGYDVLLVADHMTPQWTPLLACLAAADATTTLRFGTQVLAAGFRNPSILAKEVATLDVLTGGRFELGIGAGWPASSATGQSDAAQTSLPLDDNGTRVTRLEEAVHIIKAFLESDTPVDYEGKLYQVNGLNPFPRPVQKPHPPIMIAGAGPRLIRLAGRVADIINIAPRPPVKGPTAVGSMGFGLTINDELNLIKEAAGARYNDIELCVFADRMNITSDDRGGLVEKLAESMKTTPDMVEEMPHTLLGTTDHMIERIQQSRDKYGVTYRIIPAYAGDAFAPVVKALKGK